MSNVNSNTVVEFDQNVTLGASRRMAVRRTARTGQDTPAKAVLPVLQDVGLVRKAYGGSNGLLSVKGGSGALNVLLSDGLDHSFAELCQCLADNGTKSPEARTRACLQNCVWYAQPAPLAAAGLHKLTNGYDGPMGCLCNGLPIFKGQKFIATDVIAMPIMAILHRRVRTNLTPSNNVRVRKAAQNIVTTAYVPQSPAGRTMPCVWAGNARQAKTARQAV